MELTSVFEGVEGLSADQISVLSERFSNAHETDVTGLKNKNSELLDKYNGTKSAAEELEVQKNLMAEDRAKAEGNFIEAEKLATERMNKERGESKIREDGYKGQLSDLFVGTAKSSLAVEMANTPEDVQVLEMFLQKHITMKDVDGKMQTDYGQAGSRDALIEQFKKDPSMARFLKGTQATGVGAQGASGDGQAGTKKAKELTADERIAFKQRDPVGFKKAFNLI